MASILRSMYPDRNGKPLIENSAKGLGVRLARIENGSVIKGDIDLNQEGRVINNKRGMSVTGNIVDLPPHRIPKRFRKRGIENAKGDDRYHIFKLGDLEFEDGISIGNMLMMVKEREKKKGYIVPQQICDLEVYREALQKTQGDWIDIEGEK